MDIILNDYGMVLDIPYSDQLVNGQSQDLCGPWAVGSLRVANVPRGGNRGTAEDIHQWTDNEVNKYMPNGYINWQGSSIQDMYNFLTDSLDPVSGKRNLHWWDISPTKQNIQKAVQAGYPVLVTANEENIIEKKTGKTPYPWHLNANHIFPIVGIDQGGDYICADELNANYQGYWPVTYLSWNLNPSWAAIVQVVGPDPDNPWLAPIPDNNPSAWNNFNAQLFNKSVTPPVDYKAIQALAIFNATASLFKTPIDASKDQVALEWLTKYYPKYNMSPPIARINTCDWNGNAIEVTLFGEGRCENNNGKTRWWTLNNEVTF